ncbi:MAG: hypothetical protein ABEJ65_10340 [bacterium]
MMEPVIVLIQLILGCGVVLYLVSPFFADHSKTASSQKNRDFSRSARRSILMTLGDLQYDFETGKINRGDYEEIRERVLNDAVDQFDADDLEELETSRDSADTDFSDRNRTDEIEEQIRQYREELK